jgi:hypothetical protein
MRVEELHFTNSKTEESNSMKNGSGVSITPNTSGSMSSSANGEEEQELPTSSSFLQELTPVPLSYTFSADHFIHPCPITYDILHNDVVVDDDTRELLRLALDNGVFD